MMDWVFKAPPSWDLAEFDDTSNMGQHQNMEVFSIGDRTMNINHSKKLRGHQAVSCLVDGCSVDLSSCRDYHRRHRVCETHSKTPVVAIDGKDRRFCQQCSSCAILFEVESEFDRFHSLGEFDEVKRSCRKRLDGHNKRRRKPRADSMYLNYGSFLTNRQGTKLLCFGGSPAYMNTFGSPPDEQQGTPPREEKFPFLLGTESDKIPQQQNSTSAQLVEPKSALALLSKHTGSNFNATSIGHEGLLENKLVTFSWN